MGGANQPEAAPATFVAMIRESRFLPLSHLPKIASVSPTVSARGGTGYISAVSKKLIPSPYALSSIRKDSFSSLQLPKLMVPIQIRLTLSPLWPTYRKFMFFLAESDNHCRMMTQATSVLSNQYAQARVSQAGSCPASQVLSSQYTARRCRTRRQRTTHRWCALAARSAWRFCRAGTDYAYPGRLLCAVPASAAIPRRRHTSR